MSVISLTDFQHDSDCAELHTHDGYTDCYEDDDLDYDFEDDPWDDFEDDWKTHA